MTIGNHILNSVDAKNVVEFEIFIPNKYSGYFPCHFENKARDEDMRII